MVTTNWHPTLSFNSIFFWIIREENPCSCWEGNGPWFPVGPFYSLPQIISLHEDSKLKITDQLLFHHKTQKNTIIAALKSTTFMFLFFLYFWMHFWRLFVFRERGREREREGEKHQCVRDTLIGCLLHAPNQGPVLQPRHVPWPGIKPVAFYFSGQHSIHWATPARAALLSNQWCLHWL